MAQLKRFRKMREDEIDQEGTWAVSYGDMVTLLLSFFILFFSINPNNQNSLQPTSPLTLSMANSDKKLSVINTNTANLPLTKTPELNDLIKQLNGVAVPNGKKLIIDFPGVSFFRSGKIPLTPRGTELLRGFASAYQPYMSQYKLAVIAYADTKKVRQTSHLKYSDNIELSALRGIAALRVLQGAGIPLKLMKTAGFGEIELTLQQLAKANNDDLNENTKLSLARRVILVIEPEEEI